ncbi:hypothetical protein F4810DRAFT_650967 [Camillea tinctor]|nr:hypothetical protein F4810DRAFT_650967 [Camillea tinctor]
METTADEMDIIPQVQTEEDAVDSGDHAAMGQAAHVSLDTMEQEIVPDEEEPIIQPEDGSAGLNGCDGNEMDQVNGEILHEEVPSEEVLVPPHVEEMDSETQLIGEDVDMVPQPGRQYPIEVVLSPPLDPDSYEKILPSWTVGYILDEVEAGDEVFYSVEFDDGRIDQVSHSRYWLSIHMTPLHDLARTS